MISAKNKEISIPKILSGPLAAVVIWGFAELDTNNPQATYMAGIIVWMALWWVLEAIPLGATALLPIILLPLFNIVPASEVTRSYAKDTVFLFVGGFMVAFAMEKWNLHRRIAFKLISITGESPSRILLGFMFSSWFLSMWISNTATTVMLLPTAMAVIRQLDNSSNDQKYTRYHIGLLLSIAYSASIGGVATLIGTPPNLLFLDFYKASGGTGFEFSFLNWMLFGLPLSFTFFITSYFLFRVLFCRISMKLEPGYFKKLYKGLGKISYEEKIVLATFSLMALCWLTRKGADFGVISFEGWGKWFITVDPETGKSTTWVNDSTVAIFFSVLLFILPSKNKTGILELKQLEKLPLNIIFLFGGGFAISKGFTESGLGDAIASQLDVFKGLNTYILIALVALLTTLITEFTSNAATIVILLPILWSFAEKTNINPLIITIPATIACSFAFMLPISTPPNAVVMESKLIPVKTMTRTGLWMNLIGTVIIMFFTVTLGATIFGF